VTIYHPIGFTTVLKIAILKTYIIIYLPPGGESLRNISKWRFIAGESIELNGGFYSKPTFDDTEGK